MGPRQRLRDGIAHSLTLLHVFIYASGAILLVGAVVLGSVLTRALSTLETSVGTENADEVLADGVRTIWLAVGAVFVVLHLVFVALVREASRRLRAQTAALRKQSSALADSFRQLEESSLGAIESLNAVVEAKDPYTSGHSHRVRRIALAIGRELGLSHDRLHDLATSALFHDIGKIAVPDAVLTKPGKLDAAEYALVKQHAAKGAEIVAKLPRLAGSVPAIRNHHERWDGRGYPDGLVGGEIPLEAAIVGLADAWDAMTSDRPYADALSLAEAFDQVHAGRGTQFQPEVVDAFFAVARGAHGELGSDTPHALAG